jgi:CelD/BcsL family acetyltransferase involved in cellulose biosynthesis
MLTASLDPLTDPRWPALLRQSHEATIFHEPAWLTLLNRHFGFPFYAVCVIGDGGDVVAGLPIARVRSRLTDDRLVALPFSDRCSPLYARGADTEEVRRLLADGLAAEHLRAGLDLYVHERVPELSRAWLRPEFVQHRIELDPDPAQVHARFAKSQVRRGIAKARREGVEISMRVDVTGLDAFYRLHLQTRRSQGVPTQPKRFITGLAQLFRQGLGFVLLAEWQGEVVAAAVFLASNGTLVYKYGASHREHLDKRPNNLLFSEAIRIGCESGAHTLDLGRSDPCNVGLRSFKRSWGSEESELWYTSISPRPPRGPRPRSAAFISWMVRNGPSMVGRVLGATRYRHAA